jgi:hypothetical protein
MKYLYCLLLFLLASKYANAQVINVAILGGSYGNGPQSFVFKDVAEATAVSSIFFPLIGAVYGCIDMYVNIINNNNGIYINNTSYKYNYTLFNVDWVKIFNNSTEIQQLATDIATPNGPYGTFNFVMPLLVNSIAVPWFAIACVDKCIVLNNQVPQQSFYYCDPTAMPDCAFKRPNSRRFNHMITSYTDPSLITIGLLNYWKSIDIKNSVIIYSPDAVNTPIYTQTLVTYNDLLINIADIVSLDPTANAIIVDKDYWTDKINFWKELNIDSILVISENTAATANLTVSIQNMFVAMRSQNYMPAVVSINMANLDQITDLSLLEYIWTSEPWNPQLRGSDFNSINTTGNTEFFSSIDNIESPQIFYNTFLNVFPEYTNYPTATLVAAITTEMLVISHKLMEYANSIAYDDIITASVTISTHSFYGLIQFDAYGRLVTINNDQIALQLFINTTTNTHYGVMITPISSGVKPIFPTPNWSDRTYSRHNYNSVTEIVFLVLNSVCLFYIISMIITTFINKNNPYIKASAYIFMMYYLLGCILTILSNFCSNLDSTDAECAARIWLFTLGFDFMFGALSLKSYRILRIFNDNKLQVKKITDFNLSIRLFGLVLSDIILNIVWNIVSGMNAEFIINDPYRQSQNYHSCGVGSYESMFIFISLSIKSVIAAITLIILYKIKDIDERYNESKQLGYSIITFIGIVVIFTALIGFQAISSFTIEYAMYNIGILLNIYLTTSMLYKNKIIYATHTNSIAPSHYDGSELSKYSIHDLEQYISMKKNSKGILSPVNILTGAALPDNMIINSPTSLEA